LIIVKELIKMLNKFWINIKKGLNPYKYYLLALFLFVSLAVSGRIYKKINQVLFSYRIKSLNTLLLTKKYTAIIKIFKSHDSYWIDTKSLFVKSFFYMKFMEILSQEMPKHIQLIQEGQWHHLSKEIDKMPESDTKKDLKNMANILETIYQFVKDKRPYSCALSPKEVDYYGEILNLMILLHMGYRENKMALITFYSAVSLQSSLFPSFANIIYNSFLNPKDPRDLILAHKIPQDKNLAFLRSLINF
jgi:hypothetical protein